MTHEYIWTRNNPQLERINMMHESTVKHLGKLILAPVDLGGSKLRILDSGTGGGLWLQEVKAEEGDKHEYVGTDIVTSWFPEDTDGITYVEQNVLKPWPGDWQGSFDVVRQAHVLGSLPKSELKNVVLNLIGLVKPGGWIELSEYNLSVGPEDEGNGCALLFPVLSELVTNTGCDVSPYQSLREWFEEARLADVTFNEFTVPVGAKRADEEMAKKSTLAFLMAARDLAAKATDLPFTTFSPEYLVALPGRMEEVLNRDGGSYKVYSIWARKP